MVKFLGTYLEPLSYAVYLLVLSLQYRMENSHRKAVLIFFYLLATLMTLYANYVLSFPRHDLRRYNEWVYNLLFFFTGLSLAYYFLKTFTDPRRKKQVYWMTLVVSLAYAASYIQDLPSPKPAAFYSYAIAGSFLSVVICCLFYFHQLLTSYREQTPLRNPDFWLVSGFFLCYFGNFFIVLSFRYFSFIAGDNPTQQQRDMFTVLWSAHNLLLFGSAMLTLIFTLWINYRKESQSPLLPHSSY